MTKIAIIGAGSVVFCQNLLSDVLWHGALRDASIALMDVNKERLNVAAAMAKSINRTRKANAKIQAFNDRKRAIDGADVVINTIGVGGFEATKKDLLIPERFGIKQTIGDTLGIGGIFRSLRSIPVLLEMCSDIERLAPNALLINYTNPMATHCLAVQRSTQVDCVGLCHGVRYTRGRLILLAKLAEMGAARAGKIMSDWNPDEPWDCGFGKFYHECVWDTSYQTLCAGINHIAAYLIFKKDGKDQYPLIQRACAIDSIRKIDRVRLELYERFGYFMTETSGHISEYLPWFLKHPEEIRRLDLRPNCYLGTCERQDAVYQDYKRKAKRGEAFIGKNEPLSIENCAPIINARVTGSLWHFNGNVHNKGSSLISNLPGDSCVEVPCVADATGIHPERVGDIPPQISAMIQTNINVQDLVVRAILERNREHVYHAAYLDPNTAATLSMPKIKELVDAMFKAHGMKL